MQSPRKLPLAIALASLVLAGTSATAAPIRMTITGTDGLGTVDFASILPDDRQAPPYGIPITIHSDRFPLMPDYRLPGDSGQPGTSFDLKVTFGATESIAPGAPHPADVVVHLTGSVAGRTSSALGSGPSGFARAADVGGWSPESPVPWPLVEPWLHADHVELLDIFGDAQGHLLDHFSTALLVTRAEGPPIPAPAPEPTTLAMLGAIAVGLVARRARARRGCERDRGRPRHPGDGSSGPPM